MIAPVKDGEVTRDPVLDEKLSRLDSLAKGDVEMGRRPRNLSGSDLADLDDEYMDAYVTYLGEQIAAREAN